MKEKIEQFLKEKESLIKEFKKWVKDKNIPLEERWDLFVKSGLGVHDNYYHKPKGIDWDKYTLYDDFYIDRYATISCDRMLERALA
jgi:hypothetical protein